MKKLSSISKAHEKEIIIKMNDNGEFLPDKNVTRAEFIQMVTNNLELPASFKPETVFDNIGMAAPCLDELTAVGTFVKAEGNELLYASDSPITREEAAYVLDLILSCLGVMMTMQYIDYNGIYEDYNQVDSKYVNSMQAVCRLGLLTGTAKALISPKEFVTHAQAVVIQARLLDITN